MSLVDLARIVIDTNIIYSAQRSKRGASALLLSLIGKGLFETHVSTALVFEYQDVLLRFRAPQLLKVFLFCYT